MATCHSETAYLKNLTSNILNYLSHMKDHILMYQHAISQKNSTGKSSLFAVTLNIFLFVDIIDSAAEPYRRLWKQLDLLPLSRQNHCIICSNRFVHTYNVQIIKKKPCKISLVCQFIRVFFVPVARIIYHRYIPVY